MLPKNKGFTLVELIIVIAVIGIIVATAYPSLSGAADLSRENDRARHEYVVNKALKQYYALTGKYPESPIPLDLSSLKNELYEQTGVSLNITDYPDTEAKTFTPLYTAPGETARYEISSLQIK